tara:strand:+ start:476 stop:787 length:312 start_codon:yes stop_codon:yes gene_type:complete
MKILKILLYLYVILLFYSCASVKEGFINQRKNSSDEFLVEKKSPLVLPPDYDELLEPKENKQSEDNNNQKIKEIVASEDNKKIGQDESSGDFEETLIKKIKKN